MQLSKTTNVLYWCGLAILLMGLLIRCDQETTEPAPQADVLYMLNDSLIEATILGTFAPPTAARVYAYANIAAYEAAIQGVDSMRSLAGQLHGLKELPVAKAEQYVPEVAVAVAFSEVAKQVVWHDYILDHAAEAVKKNALASHSQKDVKYSEKYAKTLAAAIITWMKADGYDATRKMPFYSHLKEPWAWETTPPKYTEAIEPWWHTLRPILLDSAAQFRAPPYPEFSEMRGDSFYNSAMEVYKMSFTTMMNDTAIANFWDCNPYLTEQQGHITVTKRQINPGGHWVKITAIASKLTELNLVAAAEVHALVGIALSDGFLTSWETKYHYHLIRPITYINRLIDPAWVPMLETPPFPEYTSAHSVISAAAATVLDDYFGSPFPYTDDVEVPFGKEPRSFNSFGEAAREAAISRMYGGIHFREGMAEGQKQGLKVGTFVLEKIQTRN